MRLVACRACGSGVMIDAPACPRCGAAPAPRSSSHAVAALVVAGIGLVVSGVLIPLLF
ncbi:MAG TPA: hypothetical protein VF841_15975 [Anaeromyxobacter sp.]